MNFWLRRLMLKNETLSKPIDEALKGTGKCGTGGCMLGMAAAVAPGFFKTIFDDDAIPDEDRKSNFYNVVCQHNFRITGYKAMAEWLEIPHYIAKSLCSPDSGLWNESETTDIKHAVLLLETYRDKGEDGLNKLDVDYEESGYGCDDDDDNDEED